MSIPQEAIPEIYKLHGGKCVISGALDVHLHHNFIYAGRQVEEPWCILPISPKIHDIIHGKGDYTAKQRMEYQDRLDYLMLSRASDNDLTRYSKVLNLKARLEELKEKFNSEK